MFTLVRIQALSTARDPDSGAERSVDPDHIWNHVMKNHADWHTRDVKLIYMTRRHEFEDTSLIIDAKDSDLLADFLLRHICTLSDVRGVQAILLTKMRFFPVPADRPAEFSRFTITIDAIPEEMEHIYESISAFTPGEDVTINYVGHSFQSIGGSIMVSVLARSREHLDSFINDNIRPLKGFVDAEVASISKTTRLVSAEEWQRSIGPYFVAPGGKRIINIAGFDDSIVTGGC